MVQREVRRREKGTSGSRGKREEKSGKNREVFWPLTLLLNQSSADTSQVRNSVRMKGLHRCSSSCVQ